MIRIRRAAERGSTITSWLDSRHAFSFGDYHDVAHVRFGSLRVFNDDTVAPGAGFPEHGHRDMEIVSYVVRGALAHEDSTGGKGVLRAGEVQRMTAGSGVTHSEFNPSPDEPLHFLQMWIVPARVGLEPGYEQRAFPPEARRNRLQLVVAPDGAGGALRIHQRAALHLGNLDAGVALEHAPTQGVRAYVHLVDGRLRVGGDELHPGDAALVEAEPTVALEALDDAKLLLWDLE